MTDIQPPAEPLPDSAPKPQQVPQPVEEVHEKSEWQAPAFLTLWFHPRLTISRICNTDPSAGVNAIIFSVFCAAFGSGSALFYLRQKQVPTFGALVVLAIVLGLQFWMGKFLIFLITKSYCLAGKLFGSHGSYDNVRAAIVWNMVPSVVCTVLSLGLMFAGSILGPAMAPLVGLILIVFGIVSFFWNTVISFATLSETLELSIFKTFCTLILGALIFCAFGVAAVFLIIWLLMVIFMPGDKAKTFKKSLAKSFQVQSPLKAAPRWLGGSKVSDEEIAKMAGESVKPVAAASRSGSKIKLKDGTSVQGDIVAEEKNAIYVDSGGSTGVVMIERSKIASMEK